MLTVVHVAPGTICKEAVATRQSAAARARERTRILEVLTHAVIFDQFDHRRLKPRVAGPGHLIIHVFCHGHCTRAGKQSEPVLVNKIANSSHQSVD